MHNPKEFQGYLNVLGTMKIHQITYHAKVKGSFSRICNFIFLNVRNSSNWYHAMKYNPNF